MIQFTSASNVHLLVYYESIHRVSYRDAFLLDDHFRSLRANLSRYVYDWSGKCVLARIC